MRKFLSLVILIIALPFGGLAQDIKEVSGVVLDKTDDKPLKGIMVYAFNTVAEAQDAMDYIKRQREAKDFIYLQDVSVIETNEEGYYVTHVALSGALVFLTEMADPVLEKVNGRLEINIRILVGEVLDAAVINAEGGEEPIFEVPEFDGESIKGGVKFPIPPRTGKDNARLIFQTYLMETATKDTVLFRKPKVQDGVQYHQTQLRRMAFDPEYDPLYLIADENEPLTELTNGVEWRDSVTIPDITKVYFYNCRLWMEDYNGVYFTVKDTTIFRSDRVRQPMKFLEYSTQVYDLNPAEYRKQAKRERKETAGRIDIRFPVGDYKIDLSDSVNAGELGKLRKELLNIVSGEGTTLKELHIVGIASPDGQYAKNLNLANQRMSNIMNEVVSVLPKSLVERTYKTMKARVAGWDEVADILFSDSLKAEAEAIKAIVAKYPNMDNQMQEIRKLPYYTEVIQPVLPKLRSVNYTSVVEIFRELTPEEVLEKYKRNKNFNFALYEYWHLFNMVKDEDELIEIYKRALKASSNTWMLPANNLAAAYIKRGISDTTILAPFLDLKFKVNFKLYNDGKLEQQLNQEELVANQVIMLMAAKKYVRAGQYAMILPDEGYHELKLFTRCLAGFWKRDAKLREEIVGTSPQNAVVMLLASEKVHQAFAALDSLDMEKPVSLYLSAQVMCRKYKNYYDMYNDYNEETFLDASDMAADKLAQCFRKDSTFIDVARADLDIYEKLLEKALDFYEKGTVFE